MASLHSGHPWHLSPSGGVPEWMAFLSDRLKGNMNSDTLKANCGREKKAVDLKQASGQCSPGARAGSGEAPVSFGTWELFRGRQHRRPQ